MNIHNGSVGILYGEKRTQNAPCPVLKMSVNGALTIFGPVSRVFKTRLGSEYT